MTDAEICELVNRVFAGTPRPKHFTDYKNCSESAEHDETMRSRNLDTLSIEDIGNPRWDPVYFLTPQGYHYYFPAFVRLTFESREQSYLPQFLSFLPLANNAYFSLFNKQQQEAVLTFLYHVRDHYKDVAVSYGCEVDLEDAINLWEEIVKK